MLATVPLLAAMLFVPASLLSQDSQAGEFARTAPDATHSPVINRIAAEMRKYSRDITEIPLRVHSTIRYYDESGKLKKTKHASHQTEVVKRQNTPDQRHALMKLNKGGLRRISEEEASADGAAAGVGLPFEGGLLNHATYELGDPLSGNAVELIVREQRQCTPFEKFTMKLNLWCGETRLIADKETYRPLHSSFVAAGLPAYGGKSVNVNAFTVEQDYQAVFVKGSTDPFLLPSKIVATWDTDHGRIVVDSRYELKK